MGADLRSILGGRTDDQSWPGVLPPPVLGVSGEGVASGLSHHGGITTHLEVRIFYIRNRALPAYLHDVSRHSHANAQKHEPIRQNIWEGAFAMSSPNKLLGDMPPSSPVSAPMPVIAHCFRTRLLKKFYCLFRTRKK